MRVPAARLFALALLAALLASSGCSGPGASASLSGPSATPAPVEPSIATSPSIEPTPDVQPSESLVAEPQAPEPPAASISVEGGDPVVGALGSFAWEGRGSDGPWLPGNPIHIGSGERLTVRLADPVGVVNWTVNRTPATAVGAGVTGMDQGSGEPVAFAAPPAGNWSVSVNVWFVDNLGSAAYYWLMDVD